MTPPRTTSPAKAKTKAKTTRRATAQPQVEGGAPETQATAAAPSESPGPRRRSAASRQGAADASASVPAPSDPSPSASLPEALLDTSTLRVLHGAYATTSADGLRDPEWLRQVRWRRRQRGESMRAFDIDTARQRLPAAEDYVISRKIDGEFTCLLYREGACLTLNPGGTVRVGRPSTPKWERSWRRRG